MSKTSRRSLAFRPTCSTLEDRKLTVGGFLGQVGGIISDVSKGKGGGGGTTFVGYTKVQRVYTATYSIENASGKSLTITLFSDTSKGKQFKIAPHTTQNFTSRVTTVYKVGGNTGAAPASESAGLPHPYFKLNGKTYTISKGDAFSWNGSQMRRSQVV